LEKKKWPRQIVKKSVVERKTKVRKTLTRTRIPFIPGKQGEMRTSGKRQEGRREESMQDIYPPFVKKRMLRGKVEGNSY